MEKRKQYTPEEKAEIVLEVLRDDRPLNEVAAAHDVHPNLLSRWKADFIKNAARAFDDGAEEAAKTKQLYEREKDELLKQIGQLSYENAWLKKKSGQLRFPGRTNPHD
jgi:transposase-like protein